MIWNVFGTMPITKNLKHCQKRFVCLLSPPYSNFSILFYWQKHHWTHERTETSLLKFYLKLLMCLPSSCRFKRYWPCMLQGEHRGWFWIVETALLMRYLSMRVLPFRMQSNEWIWPVGTVNLLWYRTECQWCHPVLTKVALAIRSCVVYISRTRSHSYHKRKNVLLITESFERRKRNIGSLWWLCAARRESDKGIV